MSGNFPSPACGCSPRPGPPARRCRSGAAATGEEAKPGVFADIDVAFFAAGGPVTRALAPDAVKAGCLVIDKSSAFRLDPAVPLVIPEINPEALRTHRASSPTRTARRPSP